MVNSLSVLSGQSLRLLCAHTQANLQPWPHLFIISGCRNLSIRRYIQYPYDIQDKYQHAAAAIPARVLPITEVFVCRKRRWEKNHLTVEAMMKQQQMGRQNKHGAASLLSAGRDGKQQQQSFGRF